MLVAGERAARVNVVYGHVLACVVFLTFGTAIRPFLAFRSLVRDSHGVEGIRGRLPETERAA